MLSRAWYTGIGRWSAPLALVLLGLAAAACAAQNGSTRPGDDKSAARGSESGPAKAAAGGGAADGAARAKGEPVVIELAGWPAASTTDEVDHRSVEWPTPAGVCRVLYDRWWGFPPTPGGIMVVKGRSPVTVDSRGFELITTSTFEGRSWEVQVLFVAGDGYQVRLVFDKCDPATVKRVLDAARIRW